MTARRNSASHVLLACALIAAGGAVLRAQSPVMLQGIADAELWSTDTMSTFLRRNGGDPGVVGRLQVWGAVEPTRGLVLYAYGMGERGPASAKPELELEQAGVRYTASRHLVFDAGKLTSLIGEFAARRFSPRNPLIGQPDAYPVQYPLGVQVTGVARVFDYAVALVDQPFYHEGYTPRPGKSWRPVVRAGITPYIGVRLGASYTEGPYLNDGYSDAQLDDRAWQSYTQQLGAVDLAASLGFLEMRGEAGWSRYDVPQHPDAVKGLAYYGEARYTFTPRFFVATRLERNDYPFIDNFGAFWAANRTDFHNEEYGIGYRLTASTLVKASYRRDLWHITGENQAFVSPGGKAFALQLSKTFDVIDWIERARSR